MLSAVHAIATSRDTKHDKLLVTAQKFIQGQVKYSYCRLASSTVGMPGWTFNYDRKEFSVRSPPIDEAVHKVVSKSLQSGNSHQTTL